MRIRLHLSLCALSLAALIGCSKKTSASAEGFAELNTPSLNSNTQDGDITDPTDPNGLPKTPNAETKNEASSAEILKSLLGAWSSTCRDLDSKISNSSAKDVIYISLTKEGTHKLNLFTLFFSGSRNCEAKRFQELEEHNFLLSSIQDGQEERNSALALDLADPEMKIDPPTNVLLVLANQEDSTQKGRMLLEVLDSQRTSIRLQIQEWKELLPTRAKDFDSVVLQLESLQNSGATNNRSIYYTKSQAFSRSSTEDILLVEPSF
ncbi:MAG: hypothetical protein R3A80_13190 [Bdellovibrionota bacterium]